MDLFGQANTIKFGKNRVQYHDFVWSFIETNNFVVYYYLGGQNIGRFTALSAEKEIKDIEKSLEYQLSMRVDILVYNNLSDNNQTNIGAGLELNNIGGLTKIVGNKMFIYFDGNHQNLRKQIRQGIATIIINEMMYGGNIQEVLQNSVLLNLPDWYVKGLISYIGEKWNTDLDNRLRDGILSGRYQKFNKLSGFDELYAGHFIWHYIASKYGEIAIPNLLYLTRVNRSLESGFLFVLGKTLNQTVKDLHIYYYQKFEDEKNNRVLPEDTHKVPIKIKKKRIYSNAKISSDGKYISYLSNEIGRYKLHLYNVETGKSKVLQRGGFRTVELPINYNYPLIAWHPTDNTLSVLTEKRDKIKLKSFDFKESTKTTHPIIKFQEVIDMSYMNNTTLLMSAVNKGQSDIFTYNIITSNTRQITNDFYDDLQPSYITVKDKNGQLPDKKGILFISNRANDTLERLKLDTTLPVDNFDIFFYDEIKKSDKLIRVTHTPLANESLPVQYNGDHIAYLSNINGISNRHVAYFDTTFSHYDTIVHYTWKNFPRSDSFLLTKKLTLDSVRKNKLITITGIRRYKVFKDIAYSFPQTNYSRNILEHNISVNNKENIEILFLNGKQGLYKFPTSDNLDAVNSPTLTNTSYRNKILVEDFENKTSSASNTGNDKLQTHKKKKKEKIDVEDYYFQSEFKKEAVFNKGEITKGDSAQATQKKQDVIITRARPYRVKLSSDYVVSQLDNSLIFTGYQPFGSGLGFNSPDLNVMINVSVSDLLEDHRFVGGFRIPTSFRSMEYFFTYENLKKRLDKKILYYRKNDFMQLQTQGLPLYFKLKTNYWQMSLEWPLDIIRGFRTHFAFRNERVILLATDLLSLENENYDENWGMGKVEYVFDNTIRVQQNILNGTRYKLIYEYHKRLDEKNKQFSVLGVDFRHYQRIHRQIIIANRIAASTSFGKGKIVYYLGGVDNWFWPKVNTDFPVTSNDYAFQALATNMRGFKQNIRHGNSYALLNSELRVPIFSYLINSPIKQAFIKNFQLIGFGDIGTSWEGASPYMKDNPLNTKIYYSPESPISAKVYFFKDPIVIGYGGGIRTLAFGYFIRLDYGWGLEDGIVQKPILFFSLSQDF